MKVSSSMATMLRIPAWRFSILVRDILRTQFPVRWGPTVRKYSGEVERARQEHMTESDALQLIKHLQSPSTNSSITSLIYSIPSRNKLLSQIAKHSESGPLVPSLVNVLNPRLLLCNSFNYIADHGFRLSDDINTRAISNKLLTLARKRYNFSDLSDLSDVTESHDAISLTLLIFKLCLYYNFPELATAIELSIIRKVMNSSRDEAQRLCLIANTSNIDRLVRRLCIKDPERDASDLDGLFRVVSSYNKLVTKNRTEDRESDSPFFLFSQSQVVAVLSKASPISESPMTTSQYIRIVEVVIREIGHTMSILATTHKDGHPLNSVTELNYSRLLHHYLTFCYRYIENRILHNDGGSVYTVWNVIKPFHSKLYNSDLDSPNNNEFNNFYYYEMLAKMITFFSKNVRYRPLVKDLISKLPIDAVKVSPGLMTAMIYHCSRTGDDKLADLLMEQYTDDTLGLPMKYSSGQLCALLSLSLKNQHFDRAKEIIGFARDNLLDFNSAEFNELVIATLNSNFENADQSAWSMILDKGPGEAQFAYISYINYMIDHYDHLDFGKVQYIFKNATAAISYKNRNFWGYWQLSYFKYLNRRYPVDRAITVYANCLLDASTNTRQSHESCSHLPFKTLADLEYSTNPFTSRYDKVRMVLSDEVKPLILRDIYQTAYRTFKGSDKRLKEVTTWCYKRFSDLGITDSATQIDLTKTVRQRARKLGFDLGDNNNENKKSMEEKYIENLTQFDGNWSDAYRH